MLVNNYISKIENNEKKNIFNKEAKAKYSKLKKYANTININKNSHFLFLLFYIYNIISTKGALPLFFSSTF